MNTLQELKTTLNQDISITKLRRRLRNDQELGKSSVSLQLSFEFDNRDYGLLKIECIPSYGSICEIDCERNYLKQHYHSIRSFCDILETFLKEQELHFRCSDEVDFDGEMNAHKVYIIPLIRPMH